ncbi:hypothetical protein L6452_21355 [Arctium lappa]|uniref:Uncharacterized protein n=1 Tax=Arctium lappa TaxID=4217 RepID=A0ACB9BDI2_ARCLA|nr:hypothetical protein L6452_21355 [Arctium lappa]
MGDLGKASQVQIPHPHRREMGIDPISTPLLGFAMVSGKKAGEGILDYVVGRPEPVLQLEFEEGSSRSGSKSATEILGIGG